MKLKFKLISILTIMCMLMSIAQPLSFAAEGDSGNDPIRISTAEELAAFATTVNSGTDFSGKFVELANDIDLKGSEENKWTPIGEMMYPESSTAPSEMSNSFKGTFDGGGHKITGLYIKVTDKNLQGLFGYLGEGGVIKNLTVDGLVTGTDKVGGVVGYNGGIVENCSFTGTVSGNNNVGGVVGQNEGTVKNSYNTGTVSGNDNVGGVIGQNASGMVGQNAGTVTNSYNTGTVSGANSVGGVVGDNMFDTTVTNSYNTGTVSGNINVGGVVGYNSFRNTVTNNYYLTGTAEGGIRGADVDGSASALKAEQFADNNNFTDWEFDSVWTISGFLSRPVLISNNEFDVDGDGTAEKPYLIKTKEQLAVFANAVNNGNGFSGEFVELANDIDLKGNEENKWTPIGENDINPSSGPVTPSDVFKGTFDGGGHKITGLYIKVTDKNLQGLFGYLGEGGVIKNLTVDGSVSGSNYVGGLVGYNYKGTVENCSYSGSVSGDFYVGGVVGTNEGTVKNSYNTGSVSGNFNVGGLVGYNTSTIENCYYLSSEYMDCFEGTSKTQAEFESGEVAYLLQNGQNSQVWGQKLPYTSGDAYPVLSESVDKKVYRALFLQKNTSTEESTEEYVTLAAKYANKGGTVGLPETNPTTDALAFVKWAVGGIDGAEFTAETPINEDTEIYAVGEIKYGETDGEKKVNATYGASATADLSDFVRFAVEGTETADKFTYAFAENGNTIGASISGDTLSIPNNVAAGEYTLKITATEIEKEAALMSVDEEPFGNEPFTFDVAVKVAKVQIAPPSADTTEFVYTGSAQTYTLAENAAYTISDNTSQTNVGEYTITVALNDTVNYEWSDGTTENKSYTFKIAKAKITAPSADATEFVYTGSAQTYTLAENAAYTISDNTSQTNVGEYTITVALNDKDNYEWSDGTTENKTYTFKINAKPLLDNMLIITPRNFVADGTTFEPVIEVKDGEKVLVLGTDYVLDESSTASASEIGEYTVKVNGQGNYGGLAAAKWIITEKPIDKEVPVLDDFADKISVSKSEYEDSLTLEADITNGYDGGLVLYAVVYNEDGSLKSVNIISANQDDNKVIWNVNIPNTDSEEEFKIMMWSNDHMPIIEVIK